MHAPDAPVLPMWRKATVLLPGWWSGAGFALQGMAATALALWVSIHLNLKTPYTAALTVWVVANTRPGHVLAKSFHRVCGTLLGAVAAVGMIAFLGSTPELLLPCLALWLGICTALGNLLRHYRSYFGFLAGYTAAFIVLGGYHHPDHVLETALDRSASIVVGVISISLVSAVVGKARAAGETSSVLRELQADCLDVISRFSQVDAAVWTKIRLRLNSTFLQAEDQLEYADIESQGFRLRARRQWAFSRFLIDLAEGSRIVVRRMNERPLPDEDWQEVHRHMAELSRSLESAGSLKDRELQELLGRLEGIAAGLRALPGEEGRVLQPLLYLLERWLPRLEPAKVDRAPFHLPFHLDLAGALRHGLRTTLALLLAMAFWIISAWSEGPVFVLNCAAFCALNAGMSHPGKSLAMIGVGALVATIAGFLLKFYLLPVAGGFAGLILCLAVVLVPIALMARSRNPWIATTGATGGFLVLALVQPANHMIYDPAVYLSSASATVFAAFFAIPAFALILPNRPDKESARLLRILCRKMGKLPHRLQPSSVEAWRVTAGDLLRRMQINPFTRPGQLEEGLRVAGMGVQLIRLREVQKAHGWSPVCRIALAHLLDDAARGCRNPEAALGSAAVMEAVLEDSAPSDTPARALAVPLGEYRHLLSTRAIP